MRVDRRQAIEPDKGVELKPTDSRVYGYVRAHRLVRERTAVAIAAKGVNGPLPRRGEVELVVRLLPFHCDEGFEAGVLPELCTDARHAGRRDQDPRNISVEAEGHPEFSTCRSAYKNLNGARHLGACRRMAPEIDIVRDGHNGLGSGSVLLSDSIADAGVCRAAPVPIVSLTPVLPKNYRHDLKRVKLRPI